MVSMKVLKNVGVFAMAVMVAAAPVLAASATVGAETNVLAEDPYGSDNKDTSPETPTPSPSTPAPSSSGSSSTVVENVVTTQSGVKLVSTMPGEYRACAVDGVAVTTPASALSAAFGGSGATLEAFDTTHGPKAEASLNHGFAVLAADNVAAVKGPVIDIGAKLNGVKVIDINNPITITMGIPASFLEAGYDYAVIRVQEGGRVSILTDKEADPAVVAVETDGFGVFALVKAPAGSFDKYN